VELGLLGAQSQSDGPGHLPRWCGNTQAPCNGEGPVHLMTHRGPIATTDELSQFTDNNSTTMGGYDGEEF
jgi:hypothetical protein